MKRRDRLWVEDLVPRQMLLVSRSWFRCPYCDHVWDRGGRKEGFVKARAQSHVYGCWEVCLFLLGYTIGDYVRNRGLTLGGRQKAVPIADSHPRIVRSTSALMRRRKRAGTLEALECFAKEGAKP